MSSSNASRLPSTPDMILRILQVLTENQRKLQETCDSLVATTEEIKQMVINHTNTPILRNGQERTVSSNRMYKTINTFINSSYFLELDSSIMTLLEGIDDSRVQELINNPKILGVRDFNRPPEGTHKSRILEVITSNVNAYKKTYEAELAAGGVRKEKEEHDNIMAVAPIVSEAYKNVGLITKLYVKNNILPFHPKDIRWDDLHSLEKGKHAAVLEDLLKKTKYPGVEIHNCKNSWAATSLFSECIRGITKNKVRRILLISKPKFLKLLRVLPLLLLLLLVLLVRMSLKRIFK